MLKSTSLFLCFLMFFMTTTQAATTSGLKQLVDEFNYALQVEWDQKDQNFYNNEVKKFEVELEKLQDEGLTSREMMNFIESEVKDQNVVKAIKDSMTLIDVNKLDRETSKKILMNNMEQAYKKGASWSDDAAIIGTYFAIVGVFAIMIIVLAATSKSSGGSSSGASSNGSYDSDGSSDSSWDDWNSGDYTNDSGSGDSGSGDSGSGGSDSDGDGWGDGWDWIVRPRSA